MRLSHVLVLLMFLVPFSATDAEAHLASFGSWEITERHLHDLFPSAVSFRVKKSKFDDTQIERIEATLGFRLYPEDREPTFYIALGDSGTVLGVAMFIDPRLKDGSSGDVVRLEVGISVGKSGQLKKVNVIDNKGNTMLGSRKFLKQFEGLTLKSEFTVGKRIEPVADALAESQLIANAAHEALYLMKVALGSKTGKRN